MKKIKLILSKWGIHSFLLPIFFVLHNYLQYYGAIAAPAALKILFVTESVFVCFVLILLLLKQSLQGALIVTTISGALYLFFGKIKEVLAAHFFWLSKYSVLLPLLISAMLVCIVIMRKKKDFFSLNLYLNILFSIFIIADFVQLPLLTNLGGIEKRSLLRTRFEEDKQTVTASIPRKDIYYLLFDSYPNIDILNSFESRKDFRLDTFLLNRNFYVIKKSKSNYDNTPFSMDATLNMEYLEGLYNPEKITPIEYDKALFDINHAVIFDYMENRNYKIYNLSAFKVKDVPSIIDLKFITLGPVDMILYFTFYQCAKRDIGWGIRKYFFGNAGGKPVEVASQKELNENKLYYNNILLDSVPKISADTAAKSRFVYAHFFMPHYPYFFDQNGKKYSEAETYDLSRVFDNKKFTDYLIYCNKKIAAMLNQLISNTGGRAIIIVQSDHGFYGFTKTDSNNSFKNLNSIYLPSQNYTGFYDSLSNVNTFRVLLNKCFLENIPLLKDSSISLKD